MKTVQELHAIMNNLSARIQVIQANCKHEKVAKVAHSNTGNYDPSVDSYWYVCKCPECLKSWMEDQ